MDCREGLDWISGERMGWMDGRTKALFTAYCLVEREQDIGQEKDGGELGTWLLARLERGTWTGKWGSSMEAC
jgi:hypothetical protein